MSLKSTYNQVINVFEKLAKAHYQVHTFVNNHPLQINNIKPVFPVVAIYPTNSEIERNGLQLSFKFFVMDLLTDGYSNEKDVLSDTLQIGNDFIQLLYKDEGEYGFTVNTESIRIEPFAENFKVNQGENINDDVAGWYFQFSVEVQNEFDQCNLPFDLDGYVDLDYIHTEYFEPIGNIIEDGELQLTLRYEKGNSLTWKEMDNNLLFLQDLAINSMSSVSVDGITIIGDGTITNPLQCITESNDQIQSDWGQSNNLQLDFIKNKPTIPTTTDDLTNNSGFITIGDIPTIPDDISDLTDNTNIIPAPQIQSDLSQSDNTQPDYIKGIDQTNKAALKILQVAADGINHEYITIPEGGSSDSVQTLTFATTITPDIDLGNIMTVTLTNNCTIKIPTNLTDGRLFEIRRIQGSTPYVITFGTGYLTCGGVNISQTSGNGAVDRYVFRGTSTTTAELINILPDLKPIS